MALPNYMQGNTLLNPWGGTSSYGSGWGSSGSAPKQSNYNYAIPTYNYDSVGRLEELFPKAQELTKQLFGETYGAKRAGNDYGSSSADARLASQGAANVQNMLGSLVSADQASALQNYQAALNKYNAQVAANQAKDAYNLQAWQARQNSGYGGYGRGGSMNAMPETGFGMSMNNQGGGYTTPTASYQQAPTNQANNMYYNQAQAPIAQANSGWASGYNTNAYPITNYAANWGGY